jgi:hypothetical protein
MKENNIKKLPRKVLRVGILVVKLVDEKQANDLLGECATPAFGMIGAWEGRN